MYRYSRGNQGSLPRPAWGSGNARAASPEPGVAGAGGGTPLSANGSEQAAKERLASSPQDEVILQLENELLELRNACAWKDQRIAELSRTDTPAFRLRRDVRNLAAELHHTRKELSESVRELQELQAQLAREGAAGASPPAPRDVVDSPTDGGASPTSGDRGNGHQLKGQISELQDENRQLREKVAQLQEQPQAQPNRSNGTVVTGSSASTAPAGQPSGASTQRASEQLQQAALPAGGSGYGNAALRPPYLNHQASAVPAGGGGTSPTAAGLQEEQVRQILYSTANHENAATIGPTMLQGVGTVDGAASIAKVLLSRIHSSVCAAHRRQMAMPGAPGQPGQQMAQQAMGMMHNPAMGH